MKKIIVVGMAALGALALAGCGGTKKIDPMKWYSVEFSGTNGHGTATLDDSYDWEEELGLDEDNSEDLEKIFAIDEAIDYEITPEEDLSNGDKVTLKLKIDENMLKKVGYKATSSSKEFEVSGLSDVEELDLDDYISVDYEGASPYAKANVSVDLPATGTPVTFEYENNKEVANGDIIKVTATYDKDVLAANGYKLKSDSTEIKVSGVSTYMSSIDEVTDENLQAIDKDIQADIEDQFSDGKKICWLMSAATGDNNTWDAGFSNPTVTYKNVSISDIYLLNSKKYIYPVFSDTNAQLYIVYKVDVDYSIEEYYGPDQSGSTTIYVPYVIYSPIVDQKNEYSYEQGDIIYSEDYATVERDSILTKLKENNAEEYTIAEKNY